MRTCVIGAGPSGLTTIKQLLDEGHDVTCLEKNDDLGGIWYRKSDGGDEDQMKVFDSVVLTVSMKLMSFSDFMVKDEGRVFYSHEKYRRYLSAYADAFGLRKHIRFDSSVTALRKTERGTWKVTVRRGDETTEHEFDAVAVCSGPFKTPNTQVAGLENFEGEIVHSYKYRNSAPFRGKRVLAVGLAESGADIVREISDVASECTLSLRSFSFLVPRVPGGNLATDHLTSRVHHHEMWVRATNVPYHAKALFGENALSRAIFKLAVTLYGFAAAAYFLLRRVTKAGADEPPTTNPVGEPMHPPKIDVGTAWTKEHADAITAWNRRSHNGKSSWSQKIIFCKNVTFIPNVVSGKIDVQSSGIARTEGRRVFFRDGTAKEFDTVVLCTGFVNDFSAFGGEDIVKDNNVRNLYKHAFHPRHEGRLAFIGFVRPFSGGIPICSEMQARYFALLCSGKRKLPANVDELIAADKAWEEALTELSPRATEAIPSQALFLDSLAKEIGCLLPVSSLVLSPRLLVRHWFYPFNQACYRLTGPHASYESAMEEMMREERVLSIKRILHFLGLSLLPHFLHPEHGGDMAGPEKERVPRAQIAEQES